MDGTKIDDAVMWFSGLNPYGRQFFGCFYGIEVIGHILYQRLTLYNLERRWGQK